MQGSMGNCLCATCECIYEQHSLLSIVTVADKVVTMFRVYNIMCIYSISSFIEWDCTMLYNMIHICKYT